MNNQILISHRGNITYKNDINENDPKYIDQALKYFDVEIDVWSINGTFYLGHDMPIYKISPEYLMNDKLWCHAKNIEALNNMYDMNVKNYFWHQEDQYTLTSSGFIWTYPGNILTNKSIAVMPETKEFPNIEIAYGICSDNILKYKLNS